MCILFGNLKKMWPMYVDYSDEECKRVLRSLELEAYANIVNAFRAQGSLSKERRKMLQDLCSMLGISVERHRAEIRRAVNDEHLNTIAERLFGPNTATEWAIEGRRLVPLMPRLAPQTVFTAVADSAAHAQAAKNASLPLPGKTGVREISNGIETMASRKRKELPPDSSVMPHKISALDGQYFNNLCSFENSCVPESSEMPSASINSESFSPPDSTSQVSSSLSEQTPAKTTASILTIPATSASPVKPPPKQIMLKSSSTVTTFSSFDQLNTNVLSSRPASHSPVTTAVHEEQVSTISDAPKIIDTKNSQRSSPSITVKTPSIIPTPVSSSSTSTTSSDRLPISSSATSSIGNKFLSQIRCKGAGHTRQNLSLGLKLNSQSQISQKGLSPKSSPSIKVKPDNPSNFFTKKLSQTVFSSPSTESSSQFSLSSVTESTSVTKSSIPVTKPTVKSSESSIVSSSQSSSKLTTVTKSFPKTSAPSSLTRSLFSTTTKTGAKSLPPVIFNVSSTSSALQTSTKTTVSVPNDGTKTTPQLLPKSTSVGLTSSHLKINASNSQTIQYRNDGGVMRSARIVNLSQPVGSRLPCAISPSAISALGLASNLTSSALRVTLPAGSLNTSTSMRVPAAAKPNVIVVHKAQMWPRTQQGAAVIMSSAASLPKISNDVNESASLVQKQEKSKVSGAKLAPRPITPAITSSPSFSAATIKVPEAGLLAHPFSNKSSQPDSSVPSDSLNSKLQQNLENQCKKNLLADVIEASGILESCSDKASASAKDKSRDLKDEKGSSSLPEHEAKTFKKVTLSSSVADVPSAVLQENASKLEAKSSETEFVTSTEKNGLANKLSDFPKEESKKLSKEPKEVSESVVSSSQLNEIVSNTTESNSTIQTEIPKEKSS